MHQNIFFPLRHCLYDSSCIHCRGFPPSPERSAGHYQLPLHHWWPAHCQCDWWSFQLHESQRLEVCIGSTLYTYFLCGLIEIRVYLSHRTRIVQTTEESCWNSSLTLSLRYIAICISKQLNCQSERTDEYFSVRSKQRVSSGSGFKKITWS